MYVLMDKKHKTSQPSDICTSRVPRTADEVIRTRHDLERTIIQGKPHAIPASRKKGRKGEGRQKRITIATQQSRNTIEKGRKLVNHHLISYGPCVNK